MKYRLIAAIGGIASTWLASVGFGGPLEEMQAGEWYEAPSSQLREVLPDPVPPGNGPEAIINAWNSGALDSEGERLLIWGGGHNDYGGNEIYAFDLNALSWSRVWGPSPDIPPTQQPCDSLTYSDGNPVSRHTYDGLEYLPALNAFWMHGGSRYCGGGHRSKDTWHFDFDDAQWSRQADLPETSVLEMVSAYEPTTGHVLLTGPASWLELWRFDPTRNRWTGLGGGSVTARMTAAFDYKQRKFVAVGNGSVIVYDVSSSSASRRSVSTTGGSAVVNASYPGLDYDPVSERIVAWVGGSSVYSLDLDTLTWSQHAAVGTVRPDDPPSTGIFNRWRFVPSKNVFVVVNGIDQNVFFYKLTDGGGIATILPPEETQPRPPVDFAAD